VKKITLLLILASSFECAAQTEIRLMSYNLLNFPTGNLEGRVDTLANILDYYRPHLLMIQELKTAQGLSDVTDELNDLGYGSFDHGTFIPQVSSGGGGDFPLQQNLVFDTNILRLKSEGFITTDVRDINEFILYINDPLLESGADTTFLYVYVTHLKSSEGAENQALRLSMCEDWLTHVEAEVPVGSFVLLAGDYNIYANSEPAYQLLMNEDNLIPLADPFEEYGNWSSSNFSHKEILTQSTRQTQIFNDGAGGGMDDRFDLILFSENLTQPNSILRYQDNSFKSLGNTGECYNMSITDCDESNPVPFDVLRSMYYLSDHLPQVCSFLFDGNVGIAKHESDDYGMLIYVNANNQLTLNFNQFAGNRIWVNISDVMGRTLFSSQTEVNSLRSETGFHPESGKIYFIHVQSENGHLTQKWIR
jgi:exonuclease III